jgi:putative ABC transport system permease protein
LNHFVRPLLQQSFKASGIYLLFIALLVAISATTALKFSQQQIERAVQLQAAEMLAADLVLSDQKALPLDWTQQAQSAGLKQSQVTVFSSMALHDQQFVMVNVKAIDEHFPLRGHLQTYPVYQQIQPGTVWLSTRARDLLAVKVGEQIHIADADFKVAAVIEKDSNQETGFSGFSPTVIISQKDIARTQAIQVGSRIEYRLLLAGSSTQLKRFTEYYQQQEKPNQLTTLQLKSAQDGNSRLMKPIENLQQFLQLSNILTLLLCAITIVLSSQRYIRQQQQSIALLRCMGATWRQLFMAYLMLLLLIFVISVCLGALSGGVLGAGLLHFMLQLMPQLQLDYSFWNVCASALPIAVMMSAILLFGYVLPQVWLLARTPPIHVIRYERIAPAFTLIQVLFAVLGLLFLSYLMTENIKLSVLVIMGMSAVVAVLYSLVWGVLVILKRQQSRLSVYIRQPQSTSFQVTALALGVSLIAILLVLRTDLLQRWQQQLPENTPNQFVYGLPPFDLSEFKQQLQQRGWSNTSLYPNIRARLVAKNGKAFSEALVQQQNSLRRELNLTQSQILPKDNQIIQGSAEFTQLKQVSVEANTAKALGIHIGDQLSFDLPEGQIQAKVINLRQVEWESFSPNFFFIFSPGTLDENAGSYLGSFYVATHQQAQLLSLIQQFPTTVFIDVAQILTEIKNLLQVLVKVMTILAAIVTLSGILVLFACLNLFMDERRREVALLRAFGAAKLQIKNILSIEIGLIGLFASLVACVLAEVMGVILARQLGLDWRWHIEIWLILPLCMTVLCAVVGRYRLGYLADVPPQHSLKQLSGA